METTGTLTTLLTWVGGGGEKHQNLDHTTYRVCLVVVVGNTENLNLGWVVVVRVRTKVV